MWLAREHVTNVDGKFKLDSQMLISNVCVVSASSISASYFLSSDILS